MKKRWLIPAAIFLALVLIALVLCLVLGNGGSRDEAPAGITDNLNWPGEQTSEPVEQTFEDVKLEVDFVEDVDNLDQQTPVPTPAPTGAPSEEPAEPTEAPTDGPTAKPKRTRRPRGTNTPAPTGGAGESTAVPTAVPTAEPTATPTAKPTATPTAKPTATNSHMGPWVPVP